uniref:Beta-defensin 5 n=1 Tax=Microcebus murinus TaxID=30608 RepID=A0A8C5YC31_MICMU
MRLHMLLATLLAIFQVLPGVTRVLNFERPCYLRGGICLKKGSPNCEPFRGPCRAFTVCCKIRRR